MTDAEYSRIMVLRTVYGRIIECTEDKNMHKKAPAILIALILCALMLFGCAPKVPDALINEIMENIPSVTDENGSSSDAPSNQPSHSDTAIESLSNIVEMWTEASTAHSDAVSGYDNQENLFLPLQLVGPELTLAMIGQYDLLNIYNNDGRFEGELMFSGYKAFVEKSGPKIVFGSDNVVDEETGSYEIGDRIVENGEADLNRVWIKSEEHVERDGATITHSYVEVLKMSDGSMALFSLSGNKDSGETDAVFVHASQTVYEYVVATAQFGVDFDVLSLGNGFDRAQARSFLEGAGYTVTAIGSDVKGKLVAD